jgi:hypothetical protein
MFVLWRMSTGHFGSGAISLSVDLDSARLDAVSRSLMWGSGIPLPEPALSASCPPPPPPRHWRRHGAGPEIFLHRDA